MSSSYWNGVLRPGDEGGIPNVSSDPHGEGTRCQIRSRSPSLEPTEVSLPGQPPTSKSQAQESPSSEEEDQLDGDSDEDVEKSAGSVKLPVPSWHFSSSAQANSGFSIENDKFNKASIRMLPDGPKVNIVSETDKDHGEEERIFYKCKCMLLLIERTYDVHIVHSMERLTCYEAPSYGSARHL
ncbi:hypothetical protein TREMEDRAFT_61441 [Tremella mesenterica DSM 1558]|uniref:uncharacterized protein n=1 Tax=Tremella mesenterica (strain ATCC 24925 / CBS 8224 / DSM 1558 / NBRC 9311 / NRRL Y-6157 / RJB 2259-6 / UBC 559-6) TaxID=578456 RepID=UPI0003F4A53B|nr:uncharacterized protein TREMEDRAFT_61441 [Tremella mesenterica DSM 1558]EIW70929.1 hypothetical protein TREMEDRAFT_61441 [Tremella mesenterica DSM 1558]